MKVWLSIAVWLVVSPACALEANFVAPEQSRLTEALAAPPVDGSIEQRAELAELRAIEAARTPAEVKQAQFDAENENILAFAGALGDGFDPAEAPLAAALARRIVNDEDVNTDPPKAAFHRRHPYAVDSTLQPVCKTKSTDDSYPSGHTTAGYLLGLAFAEMVPERRDALLARAESFARSRLICGVHYPSDIVAGRFSAYAVHALMTANPAYRAELAAAKAELRAALGAR